MSLRTRNAAVLFEIEGSEGVPETPTAGADGVLVESPVFAPRSTRSRPTR